MRSLTFLCLSLLILLGCASGFGQAVISTHSGLINFSEGTASLDGQAVEQKAGSFPTLKDGSTLRTESGRAEVLLTPGVFLRIDEQSAIHMISSALSDTRVELVAGSAIIDAKDATKTDAVVLAYKGYEVRIIERGVFRLNSAPGVLQAYTGVAKITATGRPPATVDDSHQFFFDIGLETEKIGDGAADAFSEWASNRSDAIAAENASVAENSADPGDQNSDPFAIAGGGYSLGLPSYGSPVTPVTPINPLMLGGSYYGANPFFNAPLGYPGISVFVVPRLFPRPYRSGYPTWLNTGRRPYPVPGRPIRPVYPGPIRSGLRPTGMGPWNPTGSRPVMPRPITPVHPGGIHPGGIHPGAFRPGGVQPGAVSPGPARVAPMHPQFARPIGARR